MCLDVLLGALKRIQEPGNEIACQKYAEDFLQFYPDTLRDVLFPSIDTKVCRSSAAVPKPELLVQAFTSACESLAASQKLSCVRIADVMEAKLQRVKQMIKIT